MNRLQTLFGLFLFAVIGSSNTQADVLLGGNANIQFDAIQLFNTTGLAPNWFYSFSNGSATATQADILTNLGGGAPIGAAATYNLDHQILVGPVSNPTGRARQITNADLDPNSPLTSWSIGEQIGIDGVTIFGGVGLLISGDFSLQYSTPLNRLSIINNFQGTIEAFRVNNPTFATTANGFTVSGDLRTGDFFPFFAIPVDQDLGFFTLNAITAVPEPSSALLLVFSTVGLAFHRRKAKVI